MLNIESTVNTKCIELAGLITKLGGDIAEFKFNESSVFGMQIGMFVGMILGMMIKEDNIIRRKFGMTTPLLIGLMGSVVGGVIGSMIPESAMPPLDPQNMNLNA